MKIISARIDPESKLSGHGGIRLESLDGEKKEGQNGALRELLDSFADQARIRRLKDLDKEIKRVK
jgi:hypothetical protein